MWASARQPEPTPYAPTGPYVFYWLVPSHSGEVFSYTDAAYVADTDQGYTDWTTAGNTAGTVTDGELANLLSKSGAPYTMTIAAGWSDWGEVPIAEAANTLVSVGCQMTSTGTAANSATYPIDANAQMHLNSNIAYINAHNKFPDNAASKSWPDMDGKIHTFASVAAFMSFATGCIDYIAAINGWLAGGDATATPPAQPITIA